MKHFTQTIAYPLTVAMGILLYNSHGALAGPIARVSATEQTQGRICEPKAGPIAPARVPATGQTQGNELKLGTDGMLQKGVRWPHPRFTLVLDKYGRPKGSVKDNLTKLEWLQNANCFGPFPFVNPDNPGVNDAFDAVSKLNSGTAPGGNCGYEGNKSDWRLPNIKELESLTDYGCSFPALSDDDGSGCYAQDLSPIFYDMIGNQSYWTSTTSTDHNSDDAFWVNFGLGYTGVDHVVNSKFLVWPVRGGDDKLR